MDRLLSLLPRYGFRASMFREEACCGDNEFGVDDGVGHLHLIRQGPVVLEHVDEPPIEVHEPTLVFYPPPSNHRLIVPPQCEAPPLCADVCFSEAERNPIALALPEVLLVPLNQLPGLTSTVTLLFIEGDERDIGNRLVTEHLCDILVVHLIRHARTMNLIATGALAGLSDPDLAPVLAAIHAEPGQSWTIEKMACMAQLSRSRFISRFGKVIGMPPAEYVVEWRMELAKSHLLDGKSIKEVARDIGYAFQPAFTKAFTSKFGISPTKWRADFARSSSCPWP